MDAVGLTLAVLLFVFLVGAAVLAWVDAWIDSVDLVLRAPAVGLAVVVVSVYVLNRSFTVATFGPWLLGALLVGSLASLRLRRVGFDARAAAPYGAVLLGALCVAALPMVHLGFRWLGNANPDLGYYVLSAQRVFHNTFDKVPDIRQILAGTDYANISHAAGSAPGGELVLALARSVTGLRGDQVFMPTIVAFHLSMIAAVGGMARKTPAGDRAAISACAILAVSPLALYSIFQQFLDQPIGLAFVCVLIAMWFGDGSVFPATRGRQTVLAAGITGALFLTYPEILGFVGAALVLGAVVSAIRRRLVLRRFGLLVLTTTAFILVALNTNFFRALAELTNELLSRVAFAASNSLFPYFLSSHGLAALWGLARFDAKASVSLTLGIALGGVLFVATVVWAARHARDVGGTGLILLVLVGAGLALYRSNAAFGVFRLAMYIQPFLIAALAIGWFWRHRLPTLHVIAAIALGALMLPTAAAYISASERSVNLAPGTTGGVIDGFAAAAAGKSRVVSGSDHYLLAELEAQLAGKTKILFISQDFFTPSALSAPEYIREIREAKGVYSNLLRLIPGLRATAKVWLHERFDFHTGGVSTSFVQNARAESWLRAGACWFAIPSAEETFFNRTTAGLGSDSHTRFERCDRLHDTLVFIHSSLGQHVTFTTSYVEAGRSARAAGRPSISFYPLEKDFAFPGRTLASAGRYLLVRVLAPSKGARLVMDLTTSPLPAPAQRLPPVTIVGAGRYPLDLVGSGSARAISPVVVPQDVNGAAYLGLDLGREGALIDIRAVTAFLRNVSLMSADELARAKPPPVVAKIPRDLGDPALLYSGIYEDGWLSDHARFVLSQPPGVNDLSFSGTVVPVRNAQPQTLTVSIDGHVASTTALSSPSFDIRVPTSDWKAARVIDLTFTPTRVLPAPDVRSVGAFLTKIGFVANQ